MDIYSIYKKSVMIGLKYDPRGYKKIGNIIEAIKDIKDDTNNLPQNPYLDTRILNSEKKDNLNRKVLVGLDVGVGELLVADRLNENGTGIGLVIAHRTEKSKLVESPIINIIQQNLLNDFGVPTCCGDKIFVKRLRELKNKPKEQIIERDLETAKLLKIPYICIHTPADNLITTFLLNYIRSNNPEKNEEIIKLLGEVNEYKLAMEKNYPPNLIVGSINDKCGKIFIDMIVDSNEFPEIYEKLSKKGYGTIITMHASKAKIKEAKRCNLNLIETGQVASDTLGMNLILDEIFEDKNIEIIECSGFKRFKRDRKISAKYLIRKEKKSNCA